jgi:alanine racemase
MDMTMLDVTGVDCAIGDVATLLGVEPPESGGAARSGTRPAGRAAIDLVEAARAAGVFPYELLTGLRLRLPRVYLEPPLG